MLMLYTGLSCPQVGHRTFFRHSHPFTPKDQVSSRNLHLGCTNIVLISFLLFYLPHPNPSGVGGLLMGKVERLVAPDYVMNSTTQLYHYVPR